MDVGEERSRFLQNCYFQIPFLMVATTIHKVYLLCVGVYKAGGHFRRVGWSVQGSELRFQGRESLTGFSLGNFDFLFDFFLHFYVYR